MKLIYIIIISVLILFTRANILSSEFEINENTKLNKFRNLYLTTPTIINNFAKNQTVDYNIPNYKFQNEISGFSYGLGLVYFPDLYLHISKSAGYKYSSYWTLSFLYSTYYYEEDRIYTSEILDYFIGSSENGRVFRIPDYTTNIIDMQIGYGVNLFNFDGNGPININLSFSLNIGYILNSSTIDRFYSDNSPIKKDIPNSVFNSEDNSVTFYSNQDESDLHLRPNLFLEYQLFLFPMFMNLKFGIGYELTGYYKNNILILFNTEFGFRLF